MKKWIIGIFALFIFLEDDLVAQNEFIRIPRGEVVDTIRCMDVKEQSYALYLPSYYTTDEKYSIIYIFEPAARGKLPVRKYKGLAEEFGYILVCSNNSRNGPLELTDKAVSAIFADTKIRFTLDTSRIYTMGFSGGARVATRLAIQMNHIKGVIACGAGFPNEYKPTKWNKFTYVGLMGELDMNFFELKSLENQLYKVGTDFYTIYFKDKHIWPSENEMRKAFVYLRFDAMRRNLVKTDTVLVTTYKQNELESLSHEKDLFKQYLGYLNLLKHMNGLSKVDELRSKIDSLSREPLIFNRLKMQKYYITVESELSKLLGEAFYTPQKYSLQWWKIEAAKLNESAKDSLNMDMLYISKRMINKVYLMAFENYMLNKDKLSFEQAARNFKIATLIKPESPYPEYYLGGLYSKNKKYGLAIKMLENSIEKGFTNLEYLKKDESFDKLRTKKKYIDLEKKLLNQ